MTADNDAPAIITAHAFTPDGEWFRPCIVCGLAEAAHATTTACQACGEPVEELGDELCAHCEWTERAR